MLVFLVNNHLLGWVAMVLEMGEMHKTDSMLLIQAHSPGAEETVTEQPGGSRTAPCLPRKNRLLSRSGRKQSLGKGGKFRRLQGWKNTVSIHI